MAGGDLDPEDADRFGGMIHASPVAPVGLTAEEAERLAECLRETLRLMGVRYEDEPAAFLPRAVRCTVLALAPHRRRELGDLRRALARGYVRALRRRRRVLRERSRLPRVRFPIRPRGPRARWTLNCAGRTMIRFRPITAEEYATFWQRFCRARGPVRAHEPGGPVGGSLVQARRAPGLFDPTFPIDEELARGGTRVAARRLPYDPRAPATHQTAPAQARASATGAGTLRVTETGTATFLGFKCQEAAGTISCLNPATGVEKLWVRVGAGFTEEEKQVFRTTHCRADCANPPVEQGLPAGATARARRVQPANPAVRATLRCAPSGQARPLRVRTLDPPTGLPADPAAQAQPPGRCVPDVIVGKDVGPFGSGWFIVIRGGQRILTANPNLCGAPIPPEFTR